MAWVQLVLAGCLEVVWALALRFSHGLSRPGPTALFAVAALASFILLARALRSIPVGTGYAVWTGIGAVGVAILGVAFLGEPRNPLRLASIALIVLGIAGLRLSAGPGPDRPGAGAAAPVAPPHPVQLDDGR
jgi:quaternary ammonium compound-resistance protein SugE